MRRLRLATLLLTTTLPVAAAWPSPPPSTITFTVRETAGVGRTSEVVRSGVPLPRSLAITSTASLAAVDAQSAAVPAEFQVLARWDAGLASSAPIQWLLVSFPATVSANASAACCLVTNGSVANPAPATPVSVNQVGDQVTSLDWCRHLQGRRHERALRRDPPRDGAPRDGRRSLGTRECGRHDTRVHTTRPRGAPGAALGDRRRGGRVRLSRGRGRRDGIPPPLRLHGGFADRDRAAFDLMGRGPLRRGEHRVRGLSERAPGHTGAGHARARSFEPVRHHGSGSALLERGHRERSRRTERLRAAASAGNARRSRLVRRLGARRGGGERDEGRRCAFRGLGRVRRRRDRARPHAPVRAAGTAPPLERSARDRPGGRPRLARRAAEPLRDARGFGAAAGSLSRRSES